MLSLHGQPSYKANAESRGKWGKRPSVMKNIPFRVSARAARLIGRENVATSQGAITELVKNAYDADATACAILFVPRYATTPRMLREAEIGELAHFFPRATQCYPCIDGRPTLRSDLSTALATELAKAFANILDLWIIDNGVGMSEAAIEQHWMVIGTNVKEVHDRSNGGRVVTGAKGIGRFALDRLGREAELFSAQDGSNTIVRWIVDWGSFEGEDKVIGDVSAVLDTEERSLEEVLQQHKLTGLLPHSGPAHDDGRTGPPLSFRRGTAIRVSTLNDPWDSRGSIRLKSTLEALLPPKDRGDFNIYVYDHRVADDSGWLDNFPPEQFDYRLTAKVQATGDVSITINRREIDVPRIRPSTFTLDGMRHEPFRKADFEKEEFSYTTALAKLMKLKTGDSDADLRAIGPFDFTLYFMKLANPTADNLERYPQKTFDVGKRRAWINQSGGIRLYRDQFRVRPYGEPNTQGSDWLLLGQRVAANPAAARRLGWRVPPQQLAGTIHITKRDNPLLADQSNREGIMNERVFALFRDVILALIQEFERDRSFIFNQFDAAYNLDHPQEITLRTGRSIANTVIRKAAPGVTVSAGAGGSLGPQAGPARAGSSSPAPTLPLVSNDDTVTLAQALDASSQKIELLQEEIQELRGMATLGTVLVSFTHELKQIKANMGSRQTRLENAMRRVIDDEKLKLLPQQVNPFDLVERWGREDMKVGRWVDFALASVSPAKRRRREIELGPYLESLKAYWLEFVASKQIEIDIDAAAAPTLNILAHEIDLDSIFYNLIVNSIEAFALPSTVTTRRITIAVTNAEDNEVTIVYRDNGPGLSEVFTRPEEIFRFGYSSKSAKATGEGTGLGMWLLHSIVNDYGGRVALLTGIGEAGFGIAVTLRTKRPALASQSVELQ
jgi:signal transduction histidine kinase